MDTVRRRVRSSRLIPFTYHPGGGVCGCGIYQGVHSVSCVVQLPCWSTTEWRSRPAEIPSLKIISRASARSVTPGSTRAGRGSGERIIPDLHFTATDWAGSRTMYDAKIFRSRR
jgi:hypothetical protein